MRLFSRDKLALGMAICAFLLTLTLFCGLWRNILGLSHAVDELRAAHASALELDRRAAILDARIADLDALPRRTAVMALENQLRDMAHTAEDLDRRLAGRHRDKLERIQSLLTEIGDDLHAAK
ncbi:hypothetical protein [Desulfomicrobium orale]|nr:hypothetical protein [Desulfomicrobium orale]